MGINKMKKNEIIVFVSVGITYFYWFILFEKKKKNVIKASLIPNFFSEIYTPFLILYKFTVYLKFMNFFCLL